MNYVSIPSLGLQLSRLAFGCAPVMGRVSRNTALRAMQTAYDMGVTHFDVARSYGYGEAESVLGNFIADKRDKVSIATKFGISPPRSRRLLGAVKPFVRGVATQITALKPLIRKVSGRTLVADAFDLNSARNSLDESLRQLKVDYVDILFLHDCGPQSSIEDDLLGFLEKLVTDGKISAWGIATRREYVSVAYQRFNGKPGIVQCEGGPFSHAPFAPPLPTTLPTILHSPFGGGDIGQATNAAFEAQLALDAAGHRPQCNGRTVGRLLIESALFLAKENIVLCSMFEQEHILSNIAAVNTPVFAPTEIERFLDCLDSRMQKT